MSVPSVENFCFFPSLPPAQGGEPLIRHRLPFLPLMALPISILLLNYLGYMGRNVDAFLRCSLLPALALRGTGRVVCDGWIARRDCILPSEHFDPGKERHSREGNADKELKVRQF